MRLHSPFENAKGFPNVCNGCETDVSSLGFLRVDGGRVLSSVPSQPRPSRKGCSQEQIHGKVEIVTTGLAVSPNFSHHHQWIRHEARNQTNADDENGGDQENSFHERNLPRSANVCNGSKLDGKFG